MTSVVQRLDPDEPVGVRIGELSRRVGVSAELLRAWERRYQLLQPARTPSGYRLYTTHDELRVRAMQDQLARGLSAAEAARVARRAAPLAPVVRYPAPPAAGDPLGPADRASEVVERYGELRRALDAYDEAGAQQVLDAVLRDLGLFVVLRDVVMPYLAELGRRWESGEVDVAQEHFASNVIRGRLASLALGWGQGVGPRAVVAGPPGELHDLPLMVFGVALNRCGWRITFLGNNTPVSDIDSAVRHLRPQLVVLAATSSTPFERAEAELTALAARVPLVLAGAGATEEVVRATGATGLRGDPVTEALHLEIPSPRPTPDPRSVT